MKSLTKFVALAICILSLSCQSVAQNENKVIIANESNSNANQPKVISNIDEKSEEINIGNIKFKLTGCVLTYTKPGKSGIFRFEFPSDCQFSKTKDGEIRVVKAKRAIILAVESSKKIDGSDCDTHIRGVLIVRKAVRISEQTQKVAMCLPNVWDEKMFYAFSLKTRPLN